MDVTPTFSLSSMPSSPSPFTRSSQMGVGGSIVNWFEQVVRIMCLFGITVTAESDGDDVS